MIVVLAVVLFCCRSYIRCAPCHCCDAVLNPLSTFFTRYAHIACHQGIHCVANLLWHLPTGVVDRRKVSRVQGLVEGEIATVLLKVCGWGCYFLEARTGNNPHYDMDVSSMATRIS